MSVAIVAIARFGAHFAYICFVDAEAASSWIRSVPTDSATASMNVRLFSYTSAGVSPRPLRSTCHLFWQLTTACSKTICHNVTRHVRHASCSTTTSIVATILRRSSSRWCFAFWRRLKLSINRVEARSPNRNEVFAVLLQRAMKGDGFAFDS
jgi:hypothetical protein